MINTVSMGTMFHNRLFHIFEFIILGLLLSSLIQAAEWESFPLRSNGTIPVWIAAGPLPNGNAGSSHDENCIGYFKDYLTALGGESDAEPVEGDIIEFGSSNVSWQSALSDTSGLVSFIDVFSADQQLSGVAYSFCRLYSNQSQKIRFRVHSDDGIRIWLNGDMIHDHHIGRGVDEAGDLVVAKLKKGKNRLLVKVDQGTGGWAFSLRVSGPEDQPVKGISSRVSLETQFTGKIKTAGFYATPVIFKSAQGQKQVITGNIVSGGLQDVICTISKDEWHSPQTFHLGDLPLGKHRVELQTALISKTGPVKIELQSSTDQRTIETEFKKPRDWEIYLLPHSHVDIGYTHVQTEVEQLQWEHLENAIEYARASEDYPAGSRFKWNAEVLWAVDGYLKQASSDKRQQFIEAVQKGWIGLDGLYGNELTGLCRPEELMRLVDFSRRLGKECGVSVESAMISDVPGYTWGMVPVLAQNGIKYFSIGPNSGHRIGSTISAWGDRPFYWVSPSGQEKVLCWVAGKAYSWFLSGIDQMENMRKINKQQLFDYLLELESSGFPYDILSFRYSIGSDNGPPDPGLADFVKNWNDKYASPRLIISTTGEMFNAFEKRYASEIPAVRGDFTPYWEDGAASSAHETGINRAAAERLVQAEALWAILDPAGYPDKAFDDAWRNVLLYNEHTWGSWNSISAPDDDFTRQQWKIKQTFALDAEKQSHELLKQALKPVSTEPETLESVRIFNTCSWPRTDMVVLPADWKLPGDLVKNSDDNPVPSQRLSTGELAFIARDIPSMGTSLFTCHKGEAHVEGNTEVTKTGLSNSLLSVDIDETSGVISGVRRKGIPADFVDHKAGSGLNDYYYVAGRDPKDPQRSGKVTITIKEKGPLLSSLLIESDAPGCNKLIREVSLIAGVDRVDITNVLDKLDIYEQEGVHLAFPFKVPDGQMRLDIAWGVVRPEADQLPGSCKNYFTVQRWVDVSNQDYGVTWAAIDAPMVEIGAITADPVAVGWIDHLQPTQKLYSYVMNNYWETNYRAGQEGPATFRYSIKPHRRFDEAAAQRFGIERSQPLIAVPVEKDSEDFPSFLNLEPEGVIVTSLKPGEDGNTWILRLFNSTGRPETVELMWGNQKPKAVYISSPFEEQGQKVEGKIFMPAYGIVTLRAERE